MGGAEQLSIAQLGGPSVGPVADVVPLREPGIATRKATSLVAMLKCPPQGWGNRSRPSAALVPIPSKPPLAL